ncbi:MAG: LytTR family DNA-binding domain-containing protein [Phaeodactylibacter sp.]|uniref:LytR/AlgR family response regulator transcription factor n=1 Tax=Phaeodactylibacter sp. TaxID=1940289 RepID=UPI0032F04AB4
MKMVSFTPKSSNLRPVTPATSLNIRRAKIALPTLEGYLFRPVAAILYLKAEGNYTTIRFIDGTQELICKTLSHVESMLGQYPQFVRVHRSFAVNIERMDRYVRGKGGYVVMECGREISVSNSKKAHLATAVELHFGARL